jgi:hypothetical protein
MPTDHVVDIYWGWAQRDGARVFDQDPDGRMYEFKGC